MTKTLTTVWTTAALGNIAEIERSAVSPESIQSGTTYVGLENITSDGGFVNVGTVANGDLASTKFKFTDAHILFGSAISLKDCTPEFCWSMQHRHIADSAGAKS